MLWNKLGKAARRWAVGGSAVVAAAVLIAAPASAQTYTGVTPPTLTGGNSQVVGERPGPARTVRIASEPASRAASAPVNRFAVTGTDVAGLVVLGGSLVAVGLVMTRRSRPRSTS